MPCGISSRASGVSWGGGGAGEGRWPLGALLAATAPLTDKLAHACKRALVSILKPRDSSIVRSESCVLEFRIGTFARYKTSFASFQRIRFISEFLWLLTPFLACEACSSKSDQPQGVNIHTSECEYSHLPCEHSHVGSLTCSRFHVLVQCAKACLWISFRNGADLHTSECEYSHLQCEHSHIGPFTCLRSLVLMQCAVC